MHSESEPSVVSLPYYKYYDDDDDGDDDDDDDDYLLLRKRSKHACLDACSQFSTFVSFCSSRLLLWCCCSLYLYGNSVCLYCRSTNYFSSTASHPPFLTLPSALSPPLSHILACRKRTALGLH